MILKNEGKIIERSLSAAKAAIDFVNICDTGSTDDTKLIVTKWCEGNNLPYHIHDHEWINFGHNRTLSIVSAFETFPQATYLLLIDADMVLKVHADFDREKLKESAYCLQQVTSWLSYNNIRLIKNQSSIKWESVGCTHEYYRATPSVRAPLLSTMHIDDIGDGGAKDDKFIRDERLLEQGIIDEPENTRYFFYLMQTKKDMGKWEEAIEVAEKVLSMNGWIEEKFMAAFAIGNICSHLGQKSKAVDYYLKAYGIRNTRAESLYELSKHYREQSQHWLCYTFASIGSKIPLPKDGLFVRYHVYEGLFDYELSISCFYIQGREEQGYKACLKVLSSKLPPSIIEATKNNMKFYEAKFPHLVRKRKGKR